MLQDIAVNPVSYIRNLSANLSSVVRHFYDLCISICRIMSHELIPAQVQKRMYVFLKLLENPHNLHFIKKITSGYFYSLTIA